MTAHLPECDVHDRSECISRGHMPMWDITGPVPCGTPCICPALRACTVRVLGEAAKVVEDAHHCPPPDIVLATDGGIHCLSVTHDQWLKDLRAIDRLAQEAP